VRSLFIVSADSGYGGAERSVEVVVNRLQHDVHLTLFAQSHLHVSALRKILRPPSRLVRFHDTQRLRGFLSAAAKLAGLVAAFRPDAVLTNTQRSAQILAAAARWLPSISQRSFVGVRDFVWNDFGTIFAALPSAHVIIASAAVLERGDYLAQHLAPQGRLRWSLVPNMVELPDTRVPAHCGEYALHLASANRFKGHEHLIRAAAILRERGRKVRIISRGSIESRVFWAKLHSAILDNELGDTVSLWDHVEDPTPLLRCCKCVVVATVSHSGGPETFGRTVIEAWAHRKPVVAFAAGGVRHLIEHEKDGLMVPEGDDEGLAEALWRLHADASLCRRLGENGFAKVRQSYSAEQVIPQLRAVLNV
jgi:glycosyltransferase involved in cell wall biosynthesis